MILHSAIALTHVPYLYIVICLQLILCCDWSDHGHMTTLQNWYWGAILLSNPYKNTNYIIFIEDKHFLWN